MFALLECHCFFEIALEVEIESNRSLWVCLSYLKTFGLKLHSIKSITSYTYSTLKFHKIELGDELQISFEINT